MTTFAKDRYINRTGNIVEVIKVTGSKKNRMFSLKVVVGTTTSKGLEFIQTESILNSEWKKLTQTT